MENFWIAVKPKTISIHINKFLVQQSGLEKDLNKLKNINGKMYGKFIDCN